MSKIVSVSALEFPYKTAQQNLKMFSRELFSSNFSDIERLLESYDNADIQSRNLCVPVEFFDEAKSFKEKNELFIENVLKYSPEVVNECISKAGLDLKSISDFIFVSSTGIATPSPDALLIDKMKLNPYINRSPLWGLGCAGGVSGIAKSMVVTKANPDAVVLLLCVELCSLTFIRNDLSKSNLIAAGLFSDGIAAAIICGENVKSMTRDNYEPELLNSQSRLYYDSKEVMGWEIIDSGFKVIFSKDIPMIIEKNVKEDIEQFLQKNKIDIDQIENFIIHPGGKKVIDAYVNALKINSDKFSNTRKVLKENGNMSSSTVLYVLKEFLENNMNEGYGLIASLGPGFSSEMVLVNVKKRN